MLLKSLVNFIITLLEVNPITNTSLLLLVNNLIVQWGISECWQTTYLPILYTDKYSINVTIYHDTYNGNAIVGAAYVNNTATAVGSFYVWAAYYAGAYRSHPYKIYFITIGY